MAQRICFHLQVQPGRLDAYRARHAEVWPEMRDALATAGWRNYSLFTTDSGMVIGYLECDDFATALAAIDRTEVNERWQREMAPFFEGLDGLRPDQGFVRLNEIFHLD